MNTVSFPAKHILDLKNISFAIADDLRRAGFGTIAALQQAGAINAWLAVRRSGVHEHSIHSLLALEGAITNVSWMNVPVERRAALVRFAARVFGGTLGPEASA